MENENETKLESYVGKEIPSGEIKTVQEKTVLKIGDTLYKEQITDVVERMGVLAREQLRTYLMRLLDIKQSEAEVAITNNALDGNILISSNGYVCSHGATKCAFVTAPKVNDGRVYGDVRIKENVVLREQVYHNMLCFYAILDQMPESQTFTVTYVRNPFNIAYTDFKNNRLVEIAYYPAARESLVNWQIKDAPQPIGDERKLFRRLAILEDPSNAFAVEALGFSHLLYICKNENDEFDTDVIEKRPPETRWDDILDN